MQITININIDDRIVKVLKKMLCRKSVYAFTITLALVFGTIVFAEDQLLKEFFNGQPADAEDINFNFRLLESKINSIPPDTNANTQCEHSYQYLAGDGTCQDARLVGDTNDNDTNTNASTECSHWYQYLAGDGTCQDTRAVGDAYDNTIADTNANTKCSGTYTYLSGNGECRDVRADGDLYDSTIQNSNASTLCNGANTYLNGDGTCKTVITNSNASTICNGANTYLNGDGQCKTVVDTNCGAPRIENTGQCRGISGLVGVQTCHFRVCNNCGCTTSPYLINVPAPGY